MFIILYYNISLRESNRVKTNFTPRGLFLTRAKGNGMLEALGWQLGVHDPANKLEAHEVLNKFIMEHIENERIINPNWRSEETGTLY